jgi:hypothetical protein
MTAWDGVFGRRPGTAPSTMEKIIGITRLSFSKSFVGSKTSAHFR